MSAILDARLADIRGKRIGALPLSAAEIKESDEIAIRHEIESGSSQARFAILDAYYAGLARARLIFSAPLNDDEMEMAIMRRGFKASEDRVTELRMQNVELLAALRDMVGSHGLVQRVICVAGESDPVDAMRNARALLSRIAGTR